MKAITAKEKYRLLCRSEKTIPLFSRDWWLDLVCGETRWDVLLMEEKGRIAAAMPLYIPCRSVVTMPAYTQTMGPWFAPDAPDAKYATWLAKRQAFCHAFIESLRAYPRFQQNFHHQITDWLPFYWQGYRQTTRYTYRLPDLRQPEKLWENMCPNIRRNILKAREKHHIAIRRGIPTDDFLQVHALTFRRQKKAVPGDTALLRKLIDACRLRRQGDLWGGYDAEGRIHAAAFLVWQDSTAYYLAGGGNPDLRASGAHSLVLWESIRFAAQVSDEFDFEGSMLPGVERFFREFGAIQTPYFSLSKGNINLVYRAWIKLLKQL